MGSNSLWVAQSLSSAFLAVLFLQSGLDKVLDWKGNREYVTGYFAKSPLRAFTTPMLVTLTLLEVLAGVVSAAGTVATVLVRDTSLALSGAVLAGVTLLALFFGQRLAKDYAAAAGLVPYVILSLGSILLLGWR